MEQITFLGIGWFLGSSLMWLYFSKAKLIRNREEWQKARLKENDLDIEPLTKIKEE